MSESDHKSRVQRSLNTYFNKVAREEQREADKATGKRKPKLEPAHPYESFEQRKLAAWLDRTGVLWCHVANERNTHKNHGAALRTRGVKRGVPDVLVFGTPPGSQYNGFAVELKRVKAAGSRATPEQKVWIERLTDAGWAARVCYGHQDAIAWLESLGLAT